MRGTTGDPRAGRRAFALALAAACLLGTTVGTAGAEAAPPPQLRQFCPTGTGAGQCSIPRGMAVDPASGNVYVADYNNHRVQEFTAWGEPVRAWGWDVVAAGPGDDTSAPEDQFEVCVPADGDVCKAGVEGGGSGQLVHPLGLAVDAAGDVYVAEGDFANRRVQKFHPSAAGVEFALMFGGEVNQTKTEESGSSEAERNLCTATSGDVCQTAVEGTGNGQFGLWVLGSRIAPSPDGETIYVGDTERIEEFDTEGHYLGNLPDPDEVLKDEGTVNSLAVDPADGALYLGFFRVTAPAPKSKPNVHKLSPAGEELCQVKAHSPTAVAVGPEGEVYMADEFIDAGMPREVWRFDSNCEAEEALFGKETTLNPAENQFSANPTDIATSTACGIEGVDLFIANPDPANSFVKLYGPPPDPDICPPPEVPPLIEDQYALSVAAASATVRAAINPNFWPDTRYYVQYGTGKCSEGGCEAQQPLPPGSLLTDEVKSATVTAGALLGGLKPATTYHYRFVAQSSGGGPVFGIDPDGPGGAGEASPEAGLEAAFTTYPPPLPARTDCANQALRSGASAQLPDCRAYEMVSPVDKNNGDIAIDETFDESDPGNVQLASPGGERATYSSFRSFASPQGAPLFNQYLSSRDPEAGWSTHSISPPRTSVPFYPIKHPANTRQFKVFSEDLCKSWFIQDTNLALVPGAPPGVASIYRRDDRDCGTEGYQLTTPVPPPGFSGAEIPDSHYYPTVQGITPDSSRTLLRVDAALTPDACKTTPEEGRGLFQLYLHVTGESDMHLVSVLPNGNAACVHSSAGTEQGSAGNSSKDSVYRAFSEDGSRVFWSASATSKKQDLVAGGSGDHPGQLYLRLDPTSPQSKVSAGKCTEAGKACTYKVSELISKQPVRFQTASPDGSRALFSSLDPDEGGPEAGTLYEFSAEPGEGGTLSTAATPIADGFLGMMGASADLGRVYFVSTKALGGGQNSEGAEAIAGRPNLYLHERGGGLTFVGTLSSIDARNETSSPPLLSPIAVVPIRRTSRVSADGMHAAFTSTASLTGFDNTDAQSGETDAEVFLYDAAEGGAGQLACLSCNPSGARPSGRKVDFTDSGKTEAWHAARIPGWEYELYPSRALSADGGKVFFESYDSLLLRDTNGKRDTYQWQRAVGEAECEEAGAELYVASSGGCLSLISSGKSASNTEFIDASADGSDVFFITGSSLVPQDFGLLDVYDARAGGGFPAPPPPAPPCEGEACQPAPAIPQAQTPASSSFEGQGNVSEGPKRPRCTKPRRRVVRGGKARCVKPKRKQARSKRRAQR